MGKLSWILSDVVDIIAVHADELALGFIFTYRELVRALTGVGIGVGRNSISPSGIHLTP